ncbi:MAG: YHS domain-containing protein [Candidatus Binataceae bacterium]
MRHGGRSGAWLYRGLLRTREYRFCSRKCLDRFDANPEQFAHA